MRNNGVSNDASSCFAACALQLQQHGLTRSRWLDFPTSFISPDRCTYACFMKILFCYVLVLIASIWPTLSYCAQQFLSTHAWFTWSLEHLLSKFLLPFLAMEDAVASVNKTTIFIWVFKCEFASVATSIRYKTKKHQNKSRLSRPVHLDSF